MLILQENDVLLCNALCDFVARLHVRHLFYDRVVEEAGSKDGAKDEVHMIVNLVFRDVSAFDGFFEHFTEEVLVGLLLVEPGVGGFCRRVRAAPIREDKSLEVEGLLQYIGQQLGVFAGKVAIDAVVRAHDAARIGDGESDLKCAQVGLTH